MSEEWRVSFDSLDERMRRFESGHDLSVVPGAFIVARLDGRSFTRMTRRSFEKPFDEAFHEMMICTVKHVMHSGFRSIFAVSHSDEISLLIHPDDETFARSQRKIISVLAGQASAAFSVSLGSPVTFDARVSVLPTESQVVDYFQWRQRDARRNALNSSVYWSLRADGYSAHATAKRLELMSFRDKIEFLKDQEQPFEERPSWQVLGFAVYHERYEKQGQDPRSGRQVTVERRRLTLDDRLPSDSAWSDWLRHRLQEGL